MQPPPRSHDLITANTAFAGLDTGAGNLYPYNVGRHLPMPAMPARRRKLFVSSIIDSSIDDAQTVIAPYT